MWPPDLDLLCHRLLCARKLLKDPIVLSMRAKDRIGLVNGGRVVRLLAAPMFIIIPSLLYIIRYLATYNQYWILAITYLSRIMSAPARSSGRERVYDFHVDTIRGV